MMRRFTVMIPAGLLVLLSLLALVAGGCSTNTELGGVRVPNARPETRITGQPPTLLEAGFSVSFNWTGSDPDGSIVGYEWKISDNGVDGISPRDTMTFDPLTGAELHPWRFTTANDSTFLVLADQPDFPGDEHSSPRSFRTHTIFVRAVDDKGEVDPDPAFMTFTSTTLVPTCRAVYPNLSNSGYKTVPPTVNIGWSGEDPDYDQKTPTQVRFLWKSAQYDTNALGEPVYIRTPFDYTRHYDKVLDFDDPEWSPWIPYEPLQDDRKVQFPKQPDGEYFLFAVQVRDTAGAVSVGLGYQVEVGHVLIQGGSFRPAVTLSEPFLPTVTSTEASYEIAGGQPINFSWTANAISYNGSIVSYRHGWDLIDPDDPNDPGWSVPPGLSRQNLFDRERAFQEGVHTFYLRVEDDSGQIRLMKRTLTVIPFVDPTFQLELMVLDQVVDSRVQNWPDASGRPRNDETFRNQFWRFLADGSGGVNGINWDRDWRDHTASISFSDMVKYKAVLCYAQFNDVAQRMFQQFRAINNVDQYVWLTPYVQKGGNFFLAGGSSMESFIEGKSNYMTPIIFDTRETTYFADGVAFEVGFGFAENPDETRYLRGPRMYPYATAGIAAIDWTSPNTKTIYARTNVTRFDRTVDCVGLKGVYMEPAFRSNWGIGPGVVADTIWTEPEIDWQDGVYAQADTLGLFNGTFPFRNDEFYDGNITTRSTPIRPQECGGDAPNGRCVEPMWRGISRFDWMREYYRSRGVDWPSSAYSSFELDDGCGPMALTGYQGEDRAGTRTNGLVYGFFSYKTVDQKPRGPRPDVYWGFDPYRFDHDESKKAIRWVLQQFGLQINP